jgi:hypothetical protein
MKPKLTINPDGCKSWKLNGEFHRKYGPAIIHPNGDKSWWIHGKCHREDGPAVEYANGVGLFYLDDCHFRKNDYYKELVKRGIITQEEALLELL